MAPTPTSTSPYSTRFKVVAVAVLTLAVAAFVGAYLATSDDGDDELGATGETEGGAAVVEQRIPAPASQVPQQSTVGIDLAAGWEGTLRLNEVEIPLDQLTLTPELARIEFTPGEDKVIEQLPAGPNCVKAVVWPIAEGRAASRSVDWCFTAV